MRTRIITALAVLSISCAAFAGDEQRQISVNGNASVTAQPDIARISMAVVERNKSVSVAQQAASAVSEDILRLVERLGIERQYIDTTGLNIRADYRWNRESNEQELVGYIVERRISVELRDLDNLGKLLEGAVEAGANQVSPPQFDHTDRAGLHRRALADAVRDARANAAAMVAAADAELGDVISIRSGAGAPPPQPMMRAMAAGAVADSAAESYVAADMRFEAAVSIVYEIATD